MMRQAKWTASRTVMPPCRARKGSESTSDDEPMEMNIMIPEQADQWMQETGHWAQAATELTDREAAEARDTLQQKLLDDWLARPRDPAIVGVPDDLLARAADTMITHTRKAITAVRQLGMLKNHEHSDIVAARKHTDMVLALPTLLLRAAGRPEHSAQQKRQGGQHPDTPR